MVPGQLQAVGCSVSCAPPASFGVSAVHIHRPWSLMQQQVVDHGAQNRFRATGVFITALEAPTVNNLPMPILQQWMLNK